MTKEKSIEIIQELWRYKETDKYTETEIRQALDMAIEALTQKSCSMFFVTDYRCPNCGARMEVGK